MNTKEIAIKKAKSVMSRLGLSGEMTPTSEEQFGRFNFMYVFECNDEMKLHILVNTTKEYVWWQLLAR